jgi:cobalamin 5'-phosphate synthase/cobalamin synthase
MTTIIAQPDTQSRSLLTAVYQPIALAVTFLTRIPLPIWGEVTPADLRRSMGIYPAVGALLGFAGLKLYWLLQYCQLASQPVAAALVIVLLEAITGALHLDGLMDTCDGIGSNAPRERALEIMKDSRVGAMGVFGAVAIILIKWNGLAAMDTNHALPALVVGWAAARALPSWNVRFFPYARKAGTGSSLRYSHTLSTDMLYVAARAHHPLVATVRLALPLTELNASRRSTRSS